MAQTPPPPPPQAVNGTSETPAQGWVRRAWAIVGIVGGFLLLIVPGIFAIRSYRRWRSGQIPKPIFAWTFAWISSSWLALSVIVGVFLFTTPLLDDDFSSVDSGWPVERAAGFTLSYVEGAYQIELLSEPASTSRWSWGTNEYAVSVEADVMEVTEPESADFVAVGCWESSGNGYFFALGADDTYAIVRFDVGEPTVLAEGPGGGAIHPLGKINRIRGECRENQYGPTSLAMFVNGTRLVEVSERTETDGFSTFGSIGLTAGTMAEGTVRVRFDNVLAKRLP